MSDTNPDAHVRRRRQRRATRIAVALAAALVPATAFRAGLAPAAAQTTGAPVERTVAAVGDMACKPSGAVTASACRQRAVSDLIVADPAIDGLLALGDLQYENGELANFVSSYQQSYGRLKDRTFPTPGNHEYNTTGAAGYFGYFGTQAHPETNGYYSVDLSPSWHLVVLNSNCSKVGGCDAASAQHAWLQADLAANTRPCIAAMWHHPLFSSTSGTETSSTSALWSALTAAQADVVLTGHAHSYERFAPQRADRTADPGAPREFVVGTGGREVVSPGAPQVNSAVRGTGFGFLKLQLRKEAFSWQFVGDPATTALADSGEAVCHRSAQYVAPLRVQASAGRVSCDFSPVSATWTGGRAPYTVEWSPNVEVTGGTATSSTGIALPYTGPTAGVRITSADGQVAGASAVLRFTCTP